MDNSVPDFRVRRDVDRNPGGDSRSYQSLCKGCHAGMDALAGAFSYYDFTTGKIFYDRREPEVDSKINHNPLYSDGHITTSDSWVNLWNKGQNAELGFPQGDHGYGVSSLGKMIVETTSFSQCMATQVFETVCFKKPQTSGEKQVIVNLAQSFRDDNHNMKNLFVNTALTCLGE